MERKRYIEQLFVWKNQRNHKPLILEGARQVGKTWLMQEFAHQAFEHVLYLRFDKEVTLRNIFQGDFDIHRILRDLEIYSHTKIVPENTVLLFDEIQTCKNALTSLKYFCEERPDIFIIAAGSLLGLQYRNEDAEGQESDEGGTGFPVGKVTSLFVYPLSFREFLIAMGEGALAEEIEARHWPLVTRFHDRLAGLLRQYYVVGGMPEVVQAYVDNQDFEQVRQLQWDILAGYQKDISKHAPVREVPRIEMVWKSIPAQLAKENRRFSYAAVKRHGRANEFQLPLAWLEEAGMIYINGRVTVPRLPLSSYSNCAFKVFLLDVGLLAALSRLDYRVILEGTRIFSEFKGALTEQFVLQELVAELKYEPHYWSTEDSRGEIDFLYSEKMEVFPLEVKAECNVRSQSLKAYVKRFHPMAAIRVSMLPYVEQQLSVDGAVCRLFNFPLYALAALAQLGK